MAYTNEDIAENAEKGFAGFCKASTIGTIFVIVTLLLMAAFLL